MFSISPLATGVWCSNFTSLPDLAKDHLTLERTQNRFLSHAGLFLNWSIHVTTFNLCAVPIVSNVRNVKCNGIVQIRIKSLLPVRVVRRSRTSNERCRPRWRSALSEALVSMVWSAPDHSPSRNRTFHSAIYPSPTPDSCSTLHRVPFWWSDCTCPRPWDKLRGWSSWFFHGFQKPKITNGQHKNRYSQKDLIEKPISSKHS